MSQSANRLKAKKKLATVKEEGTTRPKLKNTKIKNSLSAAPANSPEPNPSMFKRHVVSADLEIVPTKKKPKKVPKEGLGLLTNTKLVTNLSPTRVENKQLQSSDKSAIVNKDSRANYVTHIINNHRDNCKVNPPMNSVEDLQRPIQRIVKSPVKRAPNEKGDLSEKYPVLKNTDLVKKFMAVPMTNNQKGRIRQVLREIFKGTSSTLLPEVINNRIQAILKSSEHLTDIDLRKIRILYNMLKKSTENQQYSMEIDSDSNIDKKSKKPKKDKTDQKDDSETKKVSLKGPKRYVLFIGNLPLSVTKEQILGHFWDLRDSIKDVRLPKRDAGKNSAIAYIELMNEPSYELALSKHHTMLGNRRISIQYTTQKNGKITKAVAKSKSAKLQALVKNGQIIGSIAASKKRSARRAKARAAAKLAQSTA